MQNLGDIKAVAIDLDGTLLNGRGRVSARNAAAVARAQAAGLDIILATGKTRQSAEGVISQLGLTLPGVFSQGHLIMSGDGRLLRERTMPPDLAAEVLHYAGENDLPLIIYDRHGLWTTAHNPISELVHHKYGEPRARLVDPAANRTPPNKILVGHHGRPAAVRAALEARFGDRLRILRAAPEFIELMSPDVSKGEGLAWLLGAMNRDPRNVMAIGDGENDIEMLQLVGIGVAMANAAPEVQAAADVVVASHDQDGVADALDSLVKVSAAAPAG